METNNNNILNQNKAVNILESYLSKMTDAYDKENTIITQSTLDRNNNLGNIYNKNYNGNNFLDKNSKNNSLKNSNLVKHTNSFEKSGKYQKQQQEPVYSNLIKSPKLVYKKRNQSLKDLINFSEFTDLAENDSIEDDKVKKNKKNLYRVKSEDKNNNILEKDFYGNGSNGMNLNRKKNNSIYSNIINATKSKRINNNYIKSGLLSPRCKSKDSINADLNSVYESSVNSGKHNHFTSQKYLKNSMISDNKVEDFLLNSSLLNKNFKEKMENLRVKDKSKMNNKINTENTNIGLGKQMKNGKNNNLNSSQKMNYSNKELESIRSCSSLNETHGYDNIKKQKYSNNNTYKKMSSIKKTQIQVNTGGNNTTFSKYASPLKNLNEKLLPSQKNININKVSSPSRITDAKQYALNLMNSLKNKNNKMKNINDYYDKHYLDIKDHDIISIKSDQMPKNKYDKDNNNIRFHQKNELNYKIETFETFTIKGAKSCTNCKESNEIKKQFLKNLKNVYLKEIETITNENKDLKNIIKSDSIKYGDSIKFNFDAEINELKLSLKNILKTCKINNVKSNKNDIKEKEMKMDKYNKFPNYTNKKTASTTTFNETEINDLILKLETLNEYFLVERVKLLKMNQNLENEISVLREKGSMYEYLYKINKNLIYSDKNEVYIDFFENKFDYDYLVKNYNFKDLKHNNIKENEVNSKIQSQSQSQSQSLLSIADEIESYNFVKNLKMNKNTK